jgi:hypothetical protein
MFLQSDGTNYRFTPVMLVGALRMALGSGTHSTTATFSSIKSVCDDVARKIHFFSTKWPNARRNDHCHIQINKSAYQNEADASREREISKKMRQNA